MKRQDDENAVLSEVLAVCKVTGSPLLKALVIYRRSHMIRVIHKVIVSAHDQATLSPTLCIMCTMYTHRSTRVPTAEEVNDQSVFKRFAKS